MSHQFVVIFLQLGRNFPLHLVDCFIEIIVRRRCGQGLMRHFDDKFDLVTLLILTYYHFAVDDAVKVLIELIASFS